MKRNSVLKSVVLSTAVSMFLIGCSAVDDLKSDLESQYSDGSTSDFEKKYSDEIQKVIEQLSISGKAVDGYLKDAVVCLDFNHDGYCQSGSEPMTTTLSDGSFKLNISAEQRANKNFDEAMLLVFDGIDMDTGKAFDGKLYAPNDGSSIVNVSPITTLVAKDLQKEIKDKNLSREQIQEKLKESKQKVAKALEIEEHEIGLDPIEYKKKNNDDKLIRTSLKVQKSIEAIVIASEIEDDKRDEKIDKLYEVLADGLDDMDGSEKGVENLLQKAVAKESFKKIVSKDDQGSKEVLKVADAVSKNIDTAFDSIDDDEDQLKKVAVVTRDSFSKIKEGISKKDSGFIESIRYKDGDHFDWEKIYIEDDLRELGIAVTDDLVKKIKSVYVEEGIKAKVLFSAPEKLKESNDEELEKIYKTILEYEKKEQVKKEIQQGDIAKEEVDLKSKLSDRTFFMIEENDNDLELVEITIDKNVTFSVSSDDKEPVKLKVEGNSLEIIDHDDKDILYFKAENEKFIEFYSLKGEVIKLFKDEESAKSILDKLVMVVDSSTDMQKDIGSESPLVLIKKEQLKQAEDWERKYIQDNLEKLGIKYDKELVDEIRSLYIEEGIKPDVLFKDPLKLKESDNVKIQEVYSKIKNILKDKDDEQENIIKNEDDSLESDVKKVLDESENNNSQTGLVVFH